MAQYMRKGIELSPTQNFWTYFDTTNGGIDHTCSDAFGAIYLGVLGRVPRPEFDWSCIQYRLDGDTEKIQKAVFINPVTSKEQSLRHIIINLNDEHRWTREQIADWLESLN